MPTWNDLLADERYIRRYPDGAFYRFMDKTDGLQLAGEVNAWDLCCGAGRHTVAMASQGWHVYASDGSENGLAEAKRWVAAGGLADRVDFRLADMTESPWPDLSFHAVVCWDAMYHNTVAATKLVVANVRERLAPGGVFFGTLASTKSWKYGHGEQVEPGTYIANVGADIGALHHFYDEAEVRDLFQGFDIRILAETSFVEDDRKLNPIGSASWTFLVRKGI